VIAWILLGTAGEKWRGRLLRVIGASAILLCGLAAVCIVEQLQTGRWNAYFLVQASFHHGFHLPFTNLWPMLRGPFLGVTYVQGIWDCEAILATVVSLGVLIGVGIRARSKSVTWQDDLLVLALVIISWLGPLSQANVSYWRTDTLLLPAALLLPRLPARLAIVLTGAAVSVFPFLAMFYFNGTLV
jgi:hypothetical protein